MDEKLPLEMEDSVSTITFNVSRKFYKFSKKYPKNKMPICNKKFLTMKRLNANWRKKIKLYYSKVWRTLRKQPSRGVLRKRRSENMQQIYKRISMSMCGTLAWVFSCKFVQEKSSVVTIEKKVNQDISHFICISLIE